MDAFCPYFALSMARTAREAHGIATVSVLSKYHTSGLAKSSLYSQNWQEWMPLSLPNDVQAWKDRLHCDEIVGVYCESDSGLEEAEQFAVEVDAKHRNVPNEARRDKFLMNRAVAKAGLPIVKQKLCRTFKETQEFAMELLQNQSHCIVKPTRGVASTNVHLCKDLPSIQRAYQEITSSAIFGRYNAMHEAVLIQQFAEGTEYAVDLVSKDGEHKIAAIWRYDKRPANDAPFCYFRTELIDPTSSSEASEVCTYAKSCLSILDYKWGLSHVEVIYTKDGSRLVEVNCRQHNMDFLPITMACIGYNAFDMLLAAYLDDGEEDSYPPDTAHLRLDWDSLPEVPSLRMNGATAHLVSYASGRLKQVHIQHLDEINNMQSVLEMEVYPEYLTEGEEIRKTIDIRSDAGYVLMVNDDEDALRRDYERIVELMPLLFETDLMHQSAPSG